MSLWDIKYLDEDETIKTIRVNVDEELEKKLERWGVDKEKYYTQLIEDQIEG